MPAYLLLIFLLFQIFMRFAEGRPGGNIGNLFPRTVKRGRYTATKRVCNGEAPAALSSSLGTSCPLPPLWELSHEVPGNIGGSGHPGFHFDCVCGMIAPLDPRGSGGVWQVAGLGASPVIRFSDADGWATAI